MSCVHKLLMMSSAVLATGVLAATTGDGLKMATDTPAWPQWQARLAVVSQPVVAGGLLDGSLQFGAARLMGDRYFDLGRVGDGGGLRATGALLVGSPALALAAPSGYGNSVLLARPSVSGSSALEATDYSPTPYLGMGYSAWWARTGLGFSADLGLLARGLGRSGRLLHAADGSEDSPRTLQLAPVLQVNLSYSF